jgi:hypothetical protein
MQAPVTPEKPEIPWLKNLSSCLNYVRGEGYKEDFRVVEDSSDHTIIVRATVPSKFGLSIFIDLKVSQTRATTAFFT